MADRAASEDVDTSLPIDTFPTFPIDTCMSFPVDTCTSFPVEVKMEDDDYEWHLSGTGFNFSIRLLQHYAAA